MAVLSGLRKCSGVAGKLSLGLATVVFACSTALAGASNEGQGPGAPVSGSNFASVPRTPSARIGPNNVTPDGARALVPDGSSLFQTWSGDTEKWYELIIEPGKTYVIEALDPNGDYPNGSVDGLGVFALDGISAPLETTQLCGTSGFGANSAAPGLSNFGYRCIVRTNFPAFANTQDKRKLYIKVVGLGAFPSFQIRARESTIYGRWTTNGYDFHAELQNTTGQPVCAEVNLYPNSGTIYNGTSPHSSQLTIPAYGANKVVIPNGTQVAGDNRGALRIHACFGNVNLNTGALLVSTYAYNPVTDKLLYFFPTTANNGANSNSW